MVNSDRIELVCHDVNKFQQEQWRRHTINFFANWFLVVLAVGSSALVIVGGVYSWDHKLIAVLGVIGSITVGIQASLAIEDKAEFQRIVASDAENIQLCLKDPEISEVDFIKLRDRFMLLKAEANRKLPRGGGVEAARKLPSI
jgi:cell division septal protein FtsQ